SWVKARPLAAWQTVVPQATWAKCTGRGSLFPLTPSGFINSGGGVCRRNIRCVTEVTPAAVRQERACRASGDQDGENSSRHSVVERGDLGERGQFGVRRRPDRRADAQTSTQARRRPDQHARGRRTRGV